MKLANALMAGVLTATISSISTVALGASPSLAMTFPAAINPQVVAPLEAVTIISPRDHEVVDSPHDTWVHYYVQPGLKISKLHLFVDGGEPMAVPDASDCPCHVKLPSLTSGRHTVTIKGTSGSEGGKGVETSVIFTVIGGLR